MDCNKCNKTMKWYNGTTTGFYGAVDYENSRGPFFKCECGYEVEDCEPEPESRKS